MCEDTEEECWEKLPGLDYPSQGHTSQNYISYPLSPFIKLHCKLCLPYRFFIFFIFYCKASLFCPRCSAVKLKNLLTTKSCCDLGKSYQLVANVSSRSPIPHSGFQDPYDLLSTYVCPQAHLQLLTILNHLPSHIFSYSSSNIPSSLPFFNVLHLPRLSLLKMSHISSES